MWSARSVRASSVGTLPLVRLKLPEWRASHLFRARGLAGLNPGEALRQSREDLVAAVCDRDEVLDPHPDLAGEVDPRLYRDHVPGGQLPVAARGQPRLLVDLEADPVTEAVSEVVAV